LLTLALMTLMAALSLAPDIPQPGDDVFAWIVHATPNLLQKSMHIASYAALSGALTWMLGGIQSTALRLATAFVVAVAFGALMEWLQVFVPGRFASIYDVALNSIGALIGLGVGLRLIRPRARH
jgi:VanZ family protein